MRYAMLGQTNLRINPLVFGTLPLGPLQANLSIKEGARLIRYAVERGVNLIDTAELYRTYDYIRAGLEGFSGEVYIASKTHAADAKTARAQVENALRSMGRERLDMVHLHAARLADPFVERAEVLEELVKMKQQGYIGHIGLSTHYIGAVHKAIAVDEIEVLHPLINRIGRGLLDGQAEEMAQAIAKASAAGKGIYAMKALAGGNLIASARQSISYVRDLDGVHALALGMLSEDEIDANLALMQRESADTSDWAQLEKRQRRLQIMTPFCTGCAACVDACTEKGLKLVDGKAQVDANACVLCGYCGAACPEFIIRVV
ncbi:MAG: aldo/keto reductase [Desulfuromonadales bacterium]|nr:aldo/keto reductase [Desulfuromonadales bacterium]